MPMRFALLSASLLMLGVSTITRADEPQHWSFRPIQITVPPSGPDPILDPIDAFVRQKLANEGLTPNPPAEPSTLLRRASLDLIGLPPTNQERDAFLRDPGPDAYEKAVDRLLASPHYGETWGRHWLDAARYADSDGYEKDSGRPFAWRWRDWVIDTLNADKPFDAFTIEQLAGDLLPDADTAQQVATGFHRNTLRNREGGVDQEEFRVAAVVDRVNTTGTVWLGLTVGCAQCHDHKYDAFTQKEYFEIFAFFDRDQEVDIPAPSSVNPEAKAQTIRQGKPRQTHVMDRGDFQRPTIPVTPNTPRSLPPLPDDVTGNRLDLARWLVSDSNPLTRRVITNWVWEKYFGRGLVPTPEDFGRRGAKPSHPDLLNWLAASFSQNDWSMKNLHRTIVTSVTYRQSSRIESKVLERDPLNVYLSRQQRTRLRAETIRDSALAASGLLSRQIGGPSVRPPQPPGISDLTYAGSAKWAESKRSDRYRRGSYIWFQRTSPYPMLMTFDSPESNVCVVRREVSNTPLQALTLLNDVVFVECAREFGRRLIREMKTDHERIDHAYRLCFGRDPTSAERERLTRHVRELRELVEADPKAAALLAGPGLVEGMSAAEAATWTAMARTLLNLDEFVTRE